MNKIIFRACLTLLIIGQVAYAGKQRKKIIKRTVVQQQPGYVAAPVVQPVIAQQLTQPLMGQPQQTVIKIDVNDESKSTCCGCSKKTCCWCTCGGLCCCFCLFIIAGVVGAVCGTGNCGG